MDKLLIDHSGPLHGTATVSGAKNAVLPIMAACLLTDEPSTIENVPHVTDLVLMGEILRGLGVDSALAGKGEAFRSALGQIILPACAMAIFALAPLARMTRGAMLGVLASDYIRTARAMGLPRRKVLITYAFRNAMLPVVTVLGMVFSYMLGANVLVEKVFAWPGIGRYALDALVSLDYAPVQGFVLVMAFLFVALNCMIDILYAFIDPRVRFEA